MARPEYGALEWRSTAASQRVGAGSSRLARKFTTPINIERHPHDDFAFGAADQRIPGIETGD